MGVKIPAAFEDTTGQVTRLTGELDLLTADMTVYTGSNVSIADAAAAPLTWDVISSGADLLDRSAPAAPTFRVGGIYSVAVVVTGDALTAAGYAVCAVASGATGGFSFGAGYTEAPADTWGASGVIIAAAGDTLAVNVTNHDGAAPRNFSIGSAVLVKL